MLVVALGLVVLAAHQWSVESAKLVCFAGLRPLQDILRWTELFLLIHILLLLDLLVEVLDCVVSLFVH